MRRVKIVFRDHHAEACDIADAASWGRVAKRIIAALRPGDIIALSGALGAGKTTLVQAVAKEMGAKKTPQSPTFALMRAYRVNGPRNIKRLFHADAYRIEDDRDLLALDLDRELGDGKTVLAIEWPENVKNWLKNKPAIRIEIS